ncbi:hypothetical protein [Dapis sp. BLCC M172]|uniref:hypothetical protein n=1 Tax=Dapis sp. BLCC M172 TaxID=2975281 RepID=UPI003CF50120
MMNSRNPKNEIYNQSSQSKNGKNTTVESLENNHGESWQVGDRVMHENFGLGQVTNIFGEGRKQSLGIKFGKSKKIIDPKIAPMEKLE